MKTQEVFSASLQWLGPQAGRELLGFTLCLLSLSLVVKTEVSVHIRLLLQLESMQQSTLGCLLLHVQPYEIEIFSKHNEGKASGRVFFISSFPPGWLTEYPLLWIYLYCSPHHALMWCIKQCPILFTNKIIIRFFYETFVECVPIVNGLMKQHSFEDTILKIHTVAYKTWSHDPQVSLGRNHNLSVTMTTCPFWFKSGNIMFKVKSFTWPSI